MRVCVMVFGASALAAFACSAPFSGTDGQPANSSGAAGETDNGGRTGSGGSKQSASGGDDSGGVAAQTSDGGASDPDSGGSNVGGTGVAGRGGVAGASGSGGSGGNAPVCKPPAGPQGESLCGPGPWPAGDGAHFLIDNLEDGDAKITKVDNREGLWAFVTDGTGTTVPSDPSTLAPSPGGAEQSAVSLHVNGQGFSKWGAALVLPFRGVCPYDASAYGGIEFWAKGSGQLWVELRDERLTPVAFGGVCVEESDMQCCGDYPAKLLVLSAQWQKFSYGWSELEQPGSGYRAELDPAALVALSLNPHAADFELWIDNVAFLPPK